MKKSFFLAAIAAVALSSCSSDSDAPGNQSSEETGLVPVELGLGRSMATVTPQTRGTGTVGSTSDTDNAWHYEQLHVLMTQIPYDAVPTFGFTSIQGALGEQFNGTFFCQPEEQAANNGAFRGVALDYLTYTGGNYKYYPQTGFSEFFAFSSDDAGVGADGAPGAEHPAIQVNTDEKTMTIDFELNGSQDLMAGKATNYEVVGGQVMRGFSAKTARHDTIPNIVMDHLLTRLTFGVKVGHISARGLKVDTIQVTSPNKGTLLVAYDTDTVTAVSPDKLITWDETAVNTFFLRDSVQNHIVNRQVDVNGVVTLGQKKKLTDTPASYVIPEDATIASEIKNVGEAIFVKPGLSEYPLDVVVEYPKQVVNSQTGAPEIQYDLEHVPLTLQLGDGVVFERGKSYHVNITLYGRSDIKLETTLERWLDGGVINLDTEDPENPGYEVGE